MPHILAHCDDGPSGIKLRLEKMSYFMTKIVIFVKIWHLTTHKAHRNE